MTDFDLLVQAITQIAPDARVARIGEPGSYVDYHSVGFYVQNSSTEYEIDFLFNRDGTFHKFEIDHYKVG